MRSESTPPYRSARARGRWASALVLVSGACGPVLAMVWLVDAARLVVAPAGTHLVELPMLAVHPLTFTVIGISAVAQMLAAIPFLAWFHRSHRNLRALEVGGLRFGSGWAIGGFFVPFLNLWRPLQVMIELRQRSDPHDAGLGESDGGGTFLPVTWWLSFGGSIGGLDLLERVQEMVDPPVRLMLAASVGAAFAGVLSLVAALACVSLIREIDANQELRRERLRRRALAEGRSSSTPPCPGCGGELAPGDARCRFCGRRAPGYGISATAVIGWMAASVYGLFALAVGAVVLFAAWTELLAPSVRSGDRLGEDVVAELRAEGILEAGEEILWVDLSTEPFVDSVYADALTDRRALYYQRTPSPEESWSSGLPYEQIRHVEVYWNESGEDYTEIVLHTDPPAELEPGSDEADPFVLRADPTWGGDRVFVETLRELLGPDVPIDERSVTDEVEPPPEALPPEDEGGTAL